MSVELPHGWASALFFDFCVLQRGYDLPLSNVREGPYPIVTSAGVVARHDEYKARPPGVVTGRSGSIGRVFYIESDYWPHNTALYVKDFRGNEPKFVYYFLRGFDTNRYSASTAVPTLNRNNLRDVVVQVAPVAEQRRIVAKLEDVLAKVDACQQRLAKITALLKRFRQAILAAACSGRLTADWREEHPDADPYPVDAESDVETNEELPSNWNATRLGALTTVVTSGSRGWAKYYAGSGSTFIRAQNINSDFLNLDEIAFVRPPVSAEVQRTKVRQHDILITITGANVTKSALVEKPIEDAYVSQHVALVRLRDEHLARFLFRSIVSPQHGRKQLQASAYGQGKPGLNLDNIRDVIVVLPPLPEQQEIVRRVESLFALADQLEARLAVAQRHVDTLTPSLLARAFAGKLVPQDPNDEPASALLARIHEIRNDRV